MRLQHIPVILAGMFIAAFLAPAFFGCGQVEAPEEQLPRVQQIDGDWVDWDLYDTVDLLTI